MKTLLIVVGLLFAVVAYGQVSDERRRAYRARMEHLFAIEKRIAEIRPQRRDSPIRAENIRDTEVREVELAASQVLPGAILNIGPVVTGCPCEDGPNCSDQVWVLAHWPDKTSGVLLSKINKGWSIGPVQRWWLEYESLISKSHDLEVEDKMKERFPMCISKDGKPKALQRTLED